MRALPNRGEIWVADFEPVEGHEQGGRRPCLIVSDDTFNRSPAELVIVLPLTTRDRGIPIRVTVEHPEGGLKTRSFIMPEMIRSISIRRLRDRWGMVNASTLAVAESNLRVLLGM